VGREWQIIDYGRPDFVGTPRTLVDVESPRLVGDSGGTILCGKKLVGVVVSHREHTYAIPIEDVNAFLRAK
jgi:hypothetical protein